MSDVNLLEAKIRTEFGKGAARRTRRAGNVPAVLYGHQSDPQHLSLDALSFAAILRQHGTNARSEEHTSELQSRENLVCRLLLEKKKKKTDIHLDLQPPI